jgi:hypothetical protein
MNSHENDSFFNEQFNSRHIREYLVLNHEEKSSISATKQGFNSNLLMTIVPLNSKSNYS